LVSVVTTFNQNGYDTYGKRLLATWGYWPQEATLYVYAEDVEVPDQERVIVRDLKASCPELLKFKQRHGTQQRPFRFDAVRFSHKVFAIVHAARSLKGKMFWCDADVVAHTPIPLEFLDSCLPAKSFTSCLRRDMMYSECGFVGYNLDHPLMADFISDFERMYTEDRLFDLPEWHDSFIYDHLRKKYEEKGCFTHSLSGRWSNTTHPFINCDLGKYMDHLKGQRKLEGRSRDSDLKRRRLESYWNEVR